MARVTYITGGARSGKSGFAQSLAERCAGPLLYVATAGIGDAEMAVRVEKHRQARGERWHTLDRITSYNVCYTKLLREPLPWRRRPAATAR